MPSSSPLLAPQEHIALDAPQRSPPAALIELTTSSGLTAAPPEGLWVPYPSSSAGGTHKIPAQPDEHTADAYPLVSSLPSPSVLTLAHRRSSARAGSTACSRSSLGSSLAAPLSTAAISSGVHRALSHAERASLLLLSDSRLPSAVAEGREVMSPPHPQQRLCSRSVTRSRSSSAAAPFLTPVADGALHGSDGASDRREPLPTASANTLSSLPSSPVKAATVQPLGEEERRDGLFRPLAAAGAAAWLATPPSAALGASVPPPAGAADGGAADSGRVSQSGTATVAALLHCCGRSSPASGRASLSCGSPEEPRACAPAAASLSSSGTDWVDAAVSVYDRRGSDDDTVEAASPVDWCASPHTAGDAWSPQQRRTTLRGVATPVAPLLSTECVVLPSAHAARLRQTQKVQRLYLSRMYVPRSRSRRRWLRTLRQAAGWLHLALVVVGVVGLVCTRVITDSRDEWLVAMSGDASLLRTTAESYWMCSLALLIALYYYAFFVGAGAALHATACWHVCVWFSSREWPHRCVPTGSRADSPAETAPRRVRVQSSFAGEDNGGNRDVELQPLGPSSGGTPSDGLSSAVALKKSEVIEGSGAQSYDLEGIPVAQTNGEEGEGEDKGNGNKDGCNGRESRRQSQSLSGGGAGECEGDCLGAVDTVADARAAHRARARSCSCSCVALPRVLLAALSWSRGLYFLFSISVVVAIIAMVFHVLITLSLVQPSLSSWTAATASDGEAACEYMELRAGCSGWDAPCTALSYASAQAAADLQCPYCPQLQHQIAEQQLDVPCHTHYLALRRRITVFYEVMVAIYVAMLFAAFLLTMIASCSGAWG